MDIGLANIHAKCPKKINFFKGFCKNWPDFSLPSYDWFVFKSESTFHCQIFFLPLKEFDKIGNNCNNSVFHSATGLFSKMSLFFTSSFPASKPQHCCFISRNVFQQIFRNWCGFEPTHVWKPNRLHDFPGSEWKIPNRYSNFRRVTSQL